MKTFLKEHFSVNSFVTKIIKSKQKIYDWESLTNEEKPNYI